MGCGGSRETKVTQDQNQTFVVQTKENTTTTTTTSSKKKDYDAVLKLLLLGDSGVGKTCLLLRFADDTFNDTFLATIGIDFKSKIVDMDGKKIKLQIWDTAGQERFRTITTAYYRGAQGIFLCYDVTDETSFNNISNWARNIEQHAPDKVNRLLLATKSDLTDKKVISTEKGKALADELGIKFYETSAKNSFNVEEAFEYLAKEVKKRLADTGQLTTE